MKKYFYIMGLSVLIASCGHQGTPSAETILRIDSKNTHSVHEITNEIRTIYLNDKFKKYCSDNKIKLDELNLQKKIEIRWDQRTPIVEIRINDLALDEALTVLNGITAFILEKYNSNFKIRVVEAPSAVIPNSYKFIRVD
jgi:phage host-nuclease inhibitor protein Gam